MKKNPKFFHFNQKISSQRGWMGVVFLIGIVIGLAALVIFSDTARVGDDYYFVEEGVEALQLSLSALNSGEKFSAEAGIAQERLKEAQQLYHEPHREADYKSAINKYQKSLNRSVDSMDIAILRGYEFRTYLPIFVGQCLDNLVILADLYVVGEDDPNMLDQPINDTLNAYKHSLEVLQKYKGPDAGIEYQSKFYDVQERLRSKYAPYTPTL